MAQNEPVKQPSLAQKLQAMPRLALYLILAGAITATLLFSKSELPKKPDPSTIDLFASLMQLPDGSAVILQSDWTVSTRGESGGATEALLRILMRKNIKFVLYSAADPQAPQVARDAVMRINAERKADNQREYKPWEDYIELGYFPNAEALGQAMANNIRSAWAGKKYPNPQGQPEDVFKSPVLQGISKVDDFPMMINITASQTVDVIVERMAGKVKLGFLVTGVMGPETTVYYKAHQVEGVSVGLAGVVDLETMMQKGIDPEGANGAVRAPGRPAIPGFAGMKNFARGMNYYPALHVAMFLMILAVVIGNIGMVLARKEGAR